LHYSPWISISLHRLALDGAQHGELNSDELDRPEGAKTGAQLRTKPNLGLREYFPQLNCTNGNLFKPAHENREGHEHMIAFPLIDGLSARIGDSVSITGLCKCSNEGERDELTGKGLAAMRWVSQWQRLDLGKISNSSSLVGGLGCR
jgi:hypothetical protein